MSDHERSLEHTLMLMEAERNTWRARAEKAEGELARLREWLEEYRQSWEHIDSGEQAIRGVIEHIQSPAFQEGCCCMSYHARTGHHIPHCPCFAPREGEKEEP